MNSQGCLGILGNFRDFWGFLGIAGLLVICNGRRVSFAGDLLEFLDDISICVSLSSPTVMNILFVSSGESYAPEFHPF